MKRLALVIAALCSLFCARAQQRCVSGDMDFVNYLIGNGMASDAWLLLSQDSFHASDTLDFLRGWAGYSAKKLDEAAAFFSEVPSSSSFYDKSLFFNAISNAHLGRYSVSEELLRSYTGPFKELRSLELAGISLLEDRPEAYLEAAGDFTFSQYALTEAEQQLKDIYTQRYCSRGKSPLAAAALSAVIPGSGKIYAGELGEGIASLVVIGSMAAITAENWVKNGPANWKTLLFGTIGAAFYIGNIYGSYVSVSIHNNDLRNAQDTAILYHIHIPLRSSFD
ncbi:MAG: hypothetical protein Q4G10_01935 [Bacteroidia bacterium]|nr:hypothetical protein [Bacteroidia bacterium]